MSARATTKANSTRDRLRTLLTEMMLIPGLSGYEGRVRRYIARQLADLGLKTSTDRLGNLIATLDGVAGLATAMLFTHMDQLGFVVRMIEADGLIRIERLGGVPERALPSQAVLICIGEGRDRIGIIANKSHHATTPDEKYKVVPYADLYIDAGFASRGEALASGVDIGTPIVYRAAGPGTFRQPHRRHLYRRSCRLRGDRGGGARVAEASQTPDHPFRLFRAGGIQPARRGDCRAGAAA